MRKDKKHGPVTYVVCALLVMSHVASLFFDNTVMAYTDSNAVQHFVYMFFHGNTFHLLANLLVLFLIAGIKAGDMLFAYAVAVAASFIDISGMPTLGFSSVMYALIAMIHVRRNMAFTSRTMTFYLCTLLMFFIPGINAAVHVISYMIAWALYCLYIPLRRAVRDARYLHDR